MQVCETVQQVREARARFGAFGFVPTLGFLHEGHLGLIRRAKASCGAAAVSIFVNPIQFAPTDDLDRYPRDLPRDLELAEKAGADLVFAPSVAELYPAGFSTSVNVGLIHGAENAARPGHFAGVATVVAKLFNIVQPTAAVFGQKDAEQCAVIRKLVRDLDLPIEIDIAPTAREPDGLAMSSRNAYLNAEERLIAPTLWQALSAAQAAFDAGTRDPGALRAAALAVLAAQPRLAIDYVNAADPDTLEPLAGPSERMLLSLAAKLGGTRLIDNVVLGG
jgi:pantoate--beta-alanine ligase